MFRLKADVRTPPAKQAWRSRTARIGNLCIAPRVGQVRFQLARARKSSSASEPVGEHLIWYHKGRQDVFTFGMRCRALPWFGAGRGGLRESRSSRVLRDGPVLRRQILGLRRRDVGAKPWRQRGRDRSGAALSQPRACPHAAGLALEGDAVGTPFPHPPPKGTLPQVLYTLAASLSADPHPARRGTRAAKEPAGTGAAERGRSGNPSLRHIPSSFQGRDIGLEVAEKRYFQRDTRFPTVTLSCK